MLQSTHLFTQTTGKEAIMLQSQPNPQQASANHNPNVQSIPSMFMEDGKGMDVAVNFVLSHLKRESAYLDTVIQCSLKMKDVLHERRPHTKEQAQIEANAAKQAAQLKKSGSNDPTAPVLSGFEQLVALRSDLARQLVPVLEGRQQMTSTLDEFKPLTQGSPSVSMLAPKIEEPARSKLKKLRSEIKEKLNTIRAITMGNQAILIYNMDFYNRLLNGVSSEAPSAKAYNANGKVPNQTGSGMLKKCC
jgi:flagellar biosynthesis/type III secretory pathway chaperone